jgi:hypothetical protein
VDYVSALVPPIVMAVAFTCLVVTMIKNQGGANKSKEDAAVDAALARAEAAREAKTAAPVSETVPGPAAAAERPSGA